MPDIRTNQRCPHCGSLLMRTAIREEGINDADASEGLARLYCPNPKCAYQGGLND